MRNPFIKPITLIGETVGRKPGRCFGIYQPDRLLHTYIIGQTGAGKSTLMLNMLLQDAEQGRGFCLIDPHGDLAGRIRDCLFDNCIYWNPADAECLIGYNPLTYVAKEFRPVVASGIIDALKKQWSDAWGVRMEHLLRNALLALLDRPNSTLADIIPLFTQKSFRNEVLNYVQDDQVRAFWCDEYPAMNYKNSFDGVAPIANKLGALLSNPKVRTTLCEPKHPIRFRRLMDEGMPLIVNLSKGQLGSDVSDVLGGLIVSMVSNAAYSRTNIPEARRRQYYLYADEFHSFTTDAFADALSGLRKYGVGCVLAHQHTSQIDGKVLDSILGNVGTIIAFRIGARDAPIIGKQLGLPNPSELNTQPNYRMNVRLMINGEQSQCFTARSSKAPANVII